MDDMDIKGYYTEKSYRGFVRDQNGGRYVEFPTISEYLEYVRSDDDGVHTAQRDGPAA